MKKIKLFFAAMAAMVTMGANAQSWTASEVGAGNYMLYNVGTGQYLTRGNGWGTQASITTAATAGNGIAVKIEAVGSDFKLRTDINGDAKGLEHLDGGTIYTDQSAGKNSTWTFTQVATDNGPVYTIMSKDNHGGGANAYLTAGVDGTIVTPGTDGTIAGAQWKLMAIPAQPIGMDAASEANPVDATSLIVNANFSFPAILKNDSWTMVSNNYNACGGDVTNPNAESWRASFTLSQTITVPNGIYELTAQAAVTEYTATGADMPVVYAGDKSTPFTAMTEGENSMSGVSTSFTSGKYVVGPIRVVVTNGSLTIGVRGTRTDTWCVWDNFKLTYKGVDLSELKAALQAQINAVPALEGTTTTTAYNAAKNYADGIDLDALTTEEAISTASTELSSLVNAATALQTNYLRYNTIKTAALAIAASLDTTTPDADFDAATKNDAIDAAIASLRATFLAELPNLTIPTDPGYIDVTSVMVDNAGVHTNTDYWTKEGTPNGGYSFGVCNYGECEFYNNNFKFYQTLALTPGTWEFGVTGFHRAGNHNTNFYAGEDKILIPGVGSDVVNNMAGAKTYFDNGNGKVALKFLKEAAGEIEIGIDNQDTETDKWTIFRDFTLKYYGAPDYSVYVTRLNTALDNLNALVGSVPAAATANAATYESKYRDATLANKAAYLTAIEEVEEAVTSANNLVAPYAEYIALQDMVSAMTSVEGYTETVDGATATLTNAVSISDDAVDAATKVSTITAQIAAVKAAGLTFLAGVRSDGAHPFDITFLIANPDFAVDATTGWTYDNAPGYGHSAGEYYQTTFDFNQTITGLPKGNYELKVRAFQRPGWAGNVYTDYMAGNDNVTAEIYINEGSTKVQNICTSAQNTAKLGELDGEGNWPGWPADSRLGSEGAYKYVPNSMEGASLYFADGLYDNSVLVAVDGDLKFGFRSSTMNDGYWIIFDNFRLYYYGQSINVAMSETEPFAALADIEGANVTMARTTKVGFNTVALPFDLTATQVAEVFGEGAVVYAYSEESTDVENATVSFNTKEEQTIEANVPVLVKATKEATQIVADNVTVKTGVAKVSGNTLDFVGNYGGQITLPAEVWFVGNGALYESKGNTTIKGFRAYIAAKNSDVKAQVKMYIDGLETAIDAINADANENGVIYNIAGQRVNKAQKGIYIVNGKKVLVK